MRIWRQSLIHLFCSAIAFVLAGCITSGEVITLSLQPESVIGGETVTGNVVIAVEPANAQCQAPPSYLSCPIQITAEPADAVQIVAAAVPGLVTSDQGIIFAGGDLRTTFEVQTNAVQQETVVTLSATFLLCPSGRIPTSLEECRPQAVSQEAQLVVQPQPVASIFTCGEPFEYGEKRKPPLPIRNNLGLPPGFEELILNPEYVIGFNFTSASVALIAQPVGAECLFDDPSLGVIMGVVWNVVGAEGEPFVISIPLGSDNEVVEGFLFRSLEEMIPVTFQVDQLEPIEPEAAVLFDTSIRASSVCFRFKERRFCSLENSEGGRQLSTRQLFADEYTEQVAARIREALEILDGAGLHNPDAQVLEFEAISEIEQPERIQECKEHAESCIADLIMAPVIPPELVSTPASLQTISLVYQQEIEVAILVLAAPLSMPPDENGDTFELPAGDYVLYAQKDDDGLLALPVIARGIPDPQQPDAIIEAEIPAVIMPYVDPNGVGTVAIYDVSIYDWACLFYEQCSYLSSR